MNIDEIMNVLVEYKDRISKPIRKIIIVDGGTKYALQVSFNDELNNKPLTIFKQKESR